MYSFGDHGAGHFNPHISSEVRCDINLCSHNEEAYQRYGVRPPLVDRPTTSDRKRVGALAK